MAALLKEIYWCIATRIKIPMSFFTEIQKIDPKIHMERLKTLSSKNSHE
jgi:hypothetical protein